MSSPSGPGTRYDGTVAIFYTSHHAVHSRDWDNIEEFKGQYHPLAGYYKCDDPEVLARHLRWIRRAGVDAIVYDCYGSNALGIHDLPKDRTLSMLTAALDDQSGESRKVKLIIWLEKYAENPSLEQYEFALDWIRGHFGERDWYYRYRGKPLVLTYLNGESDAIDELEFRNTWFQLQRVRPYRSDVWSYIEHYPQMLRKTWMSACPGMNAFLEDAYLAKHVRKDPVFDLEEIRRKAHKEDREDGQFFRRQLQRATEANPEILFISGWNDWQYGSHIEPAVEYRFQYVDLAAECLGRQEETKPYREES
jgi:hypothetical protein